MDSNTALVCIFAGLPTVFMVVAGVRGFFIHRETMARIKSGQYVRSTNKDTEEKE